jgi:hypothetical protein
MSQPDGKIREASLTTLRQNEGNAVPPIPGRQTDCDSPETTRPIDPGPKIVPSFGAMVSSNWFRTSHRTFERGHEHGNASVVPHNSFCPLVSTRGGSLQPQRSFTALLR